MDLLREFLRTLQEQGLLPGRFRGLLHVLIGRRITVTEGDDAGAVVSAGMTWRAVAELLTHPSTMLGLSDAGAHASQLCDACAPTDLLGRWVHDKGVLALEEAVRRLTAEPAEVFGIADRGRLAPGLAADLAVFDPATVGCGPLRRIHDLPAGADRLVSDARGIRAVVVNGVVIRERDENALAPVDHLSQRGPGRARGAAVHERVEPALGEGQGEVLGRSGETGMAGGDHLHFGMLVHGTYTTPLEWWDDHDRAARMPHHLVGRRAQDEPEEAASSSLGHDEHVRLGCRLHELPARGPVDDVQLRLRAVEVTALDGLLELTAHSRLEVRRGRCVAGGPALRPRRSGEHPAPDHVQRFARTLRQPRCPYLLIGHP